MLLGLWAWRPCPYQTRLSPGPQLVRRRPDCYYCRTRKKSRPGWSKVPLAEQVLRSLVLQGIAAKDLVLKDKDANMLSPIRSFSETHVADF